MSSIAERSERIDVAERSERIDVAEPSERIDVADTSKHIDVADPSVAVADPGDRVEWALEAADAMAVRRTRHEVMRVLAAVAAPGADLSGTEVVVAELLTNTLRHTPGRAWVSLRWDGLNPLLSVADLGPGLPVSGTGAVRAATLPADPLAETGRGLFLVAHLALDVAVADRYGAGTVVCVTLDLERAG